MKSIRCCLSLPLFLFILGVSSPAQDSKPLPPMLHLPGSEGDESKIEYDTLPLLSGAHSVVCAPDSQWKFQLHNYLLHHDGKFWCMWSHGPVVEDVPTQHVRYATSEDGLKWSESKMLSGPPAEGRAYIARGFWVRDGELLALAASYKGKGAFGVDKDLKLVAFAYNKADDSWKEKGVLYENAINNFTPQRLSTGEWMMTRRDARFNVSMLIGGTKALNDWQAFPVVDRKEAMATSKFSPDEPVWWEQQDGTLVSAIRDNGGSLRLFRSVSRDHGHTWSAPEKTNYPNATSKLFTLQTSRGFRVLVSNANPKIGRREMHLAVSQDGLTFTRMALLGIPQDKPSTLQYPHVIEHEGSLYIAYSRTKANTELLKVSLDDVERLLKGELPARQPVAISAPARPADSATVLAIPNLVAFWDFQEIAGQARASKGGDHAYALQEMQGPVAQVEDGVFGPYAARIKRGQWLMVPRKDMGALDIHGKDAQVTVVAWVKRGDKASWQAIGGVWDETRKKRQYCLFLNAPRGTKADEMKRYPLANRIHGHVSAVGGPTPGDEFCITYSSGATEIPFNSWQCLAMSYDGKASRVFVNGKLDSLEQYNPFPYPDGLFDGGADGADFTVGAVHRGGSWGNFFDGRMGGLAIFNRALSEDELAKLAALTPKQNTKPKPVVKSGDQSAAVDRAKRE
ncbi:concanavalin A-like lectin/glucanase superfamily protein [Roseimicrobium gellanilyticum]|uniref:Concanavalin A-like lectin/glucanase superfamily protein n=2 Tax=Roseimicrobium gellanilyticum TaxID=748857 RepID=A0A366HQY9_9BACT|nr:concanavalin A-like lectin/glucanase superfamily protein [Roseimicrobium gellanilyticum]